MVHFPFIREHFKDNNNYFKTHMQLVTDIEN